MIVFPRYPAENSVFSLKEQDRSAVWSIGNLFTKASNSFCVEYLGHWNFNGSIFNILNPVLVAQLIINVVEVDLFLWFLLLFYVLETPGLCSGQYQGVRLKRGDPIFNRRVIAIIRCAPLLRVCDLIFDPRVIHHCQIKMAEAQSPPGNRSMRIRHVQHPFDCIMIGDHSTLSPLNVESGFLGTIWPTKIMTARHFLSGVE